MKGNRKGKLGRSWREHLIMDLKWTWPFIAVVCLIFLLLLYALMTDNFTTVTNILLIVFILGLVMVVYGFLLTVKTVKKAKRLSYANYGKILILLFLCIIGLFFILIMGSFLVPSYHTPMLIFELLIAGFLLGSLINARYHGSEKDWYNNIVVRYGQDITTLRDGYTDRPYSMKLLDPQGVKNWQKTLEVYGKSMTDQILIAGYERIDEGFIFYLPSPKLMSGIIGSKRDVEKATRVTTYDDGNISVYISKDDYDRIGLEITYHELCQRVLLAFADSIKAFVGGDERKASEILGGRGYIGRREKLFRQQVFSYIRVAAVLTIINVLITVGIFTQEYTELDKNFIIASDVWIDENFTDDPYLPPMWNNEREYPLLAHHAFFGRILQEDVVEGDELFVSFTANATLPEVYIRNSRTINDYLLLEIESEVLRNVSSGEFRIEGKKDRYDYRLVIDLEKDENISQQTIDINLKVKHLNGYSPYNVWIVLLTFSFYIPLEFILRRRRKNTS